MKQISEELVKPGNIGKLREIGELAVSLIVKRTRLGYGVNRNGSKRFRLAALSEGYVKQRKKGGLSSFTRPKKSNLTRTGQMLESVKVIKASRGVITIGPEGRRNDGKTNDDVAIWNANRKGRSFIFISDNEYNQLRRAYRKAFGDLLKKKRLLR
jgi:hypothetical protein